ncbi:MAG: putative metal-binding motif-containing protein [Alphaproteobacteria bacterium]|nr:putative metal-binding motif-containing protein [Alphaproteobacteria bacterium]
MLLLASIALAGSDVYGFGNGVAGAVQIGSNQTYPLGTGINGLATAGATTVPVQSDAGFTVGMLVLVHQTAGANAAVTFTHPPPALDYLALDVGQYEYARVTALGGTTLTLDAPLLHSYRTGGQVVPVREYSSLTIDGGNTLSAPAWDGARGGIVAIMVDGTLALNGSISATGRGFRGGPNFNQAYPVTCNTTTDTSTAPSKGEGVGGPAGIGRGTHANGGGAGNCNNAGGGGGGNAGVGGRGGYEFNTSNDRGGLGGSAAVPTDHTTHAILGGGGGAGSDDQSSYPAGPPGGGFLLIRARSITGSGNLNAAGNNASNVGNDGAPGGAAGGTVIVRTLGTLSCGNVDVSGGDGGDANSNHGTGGGGGGGRAVLEGTGSCSIDAAGASNGTAGGNARNALPGGNGTGSQIGVTFFDSDGDGWVRGPDGGPDCDDTDGSVNPGATDICNGVDDDCDGVTDGGLMQLDWYADDDGDGYGDPNVTTSDCTQPTGYVGIGGDCDDTAFGVNPGILTDTCDGVDSDCDISIDEDASFQDWYEDLDADGWGSTVMVNTCAQPAGYVTQTGDCDDGDIDVSPDALDIDCDGVDDDCDGVADDGAPTATWYRDADGDGYGNPALAADLCGTPAGFVANASDCNDAAPAIHPGAVDDQCDGVDDDCDGTFDEGAQTSFYWPDMDGDGFGLLGSTPTQACAQPPMTATTAGDCDDTSSAVYPAAPEQCNGRDDDCDTAVDENVQTTYFADDDGDGFGNLLDVVLACTLPPGYSITSGDCNDDDFDIAPGRPELCNDTDDDCDTQIDEGVPTSTWYYDQDQDGYGLTTTTAIDCAAPLGYAAASGDCNDTVASIHPDATETCNLIDDDCDGSVDEGAVDDATWYLDQDQDGRGSDTNTLSSCSPPIGYVLDGGDCDDLNPLVAPGLFEQCNGFDDDCDGLVDDADPSVTNPTSWYDDVDGDGYGDGPATIACIAPSGWVATNTDCDDEDASRSPAATEGCDNIDNDCDGLVDDSDPDVEGVAWYVDADGDGVGTTVQDTSTCNGGPGLAPSPGDCNDADPNVYTGAPEPCAGVDVNCDGVVEGALLYADDDDDGYGDPNDQSWICDGSGTTGTGDCDDANPAINPGATEIPDDGIDQDCNGSDLSTTPLETADTAEPPDETDVPGDTSEGLDTDDDGPIRRKTGCNCETGPRAPAWLAVLGVLGWARRRAS